MSIECVNRCGFGEQTRGRARKTLTYYVPALGFGRVRSETRLLHRLLLVDHGVGRGVGRRVVRWWFRHRLAAATVGQAGVRVATAFVDLVTTVRNSFSLWRCRCDFPNGGDADRRRHWFAVSGHGRAGAVVWDGGTTRG
jgi:hypothetical protein